MVDRISLKEQVLWIDGGAFEGSMLGWKMASKCMLNEVRAKIMMEECTLNDSALQGII